jgi:hypothetical protein
MENNNTGVNAAKQAITRDDMKKLQEYFLKKIELLENTIKDIESENKAIKKNTNEITNDEMHSKEIDKLAEALSVAQQSMTIAAKDSRAHNSVYARFPDLKRAADPALNKNGLSVTQLYHNDKIVTLLIHSSGQWIKSEVNVKDYINPNTRLSRQQEFGSTRSYLKRYAYQDITGVVDEKEDDNNGYK